MGISKIHEFIIIVISEIMKSRNSYIIGNPPVQNPLRNPAPCLSCRSRACVTSLPRFRDNTQRPTHHFRVGVPAGEEIRTVLSVWATGADSQQSVLSYRSVCERLSTTETFWKLWKIRKCTILKPTPFFIWWWVRFNFGSMAKLRSTTAVLHSLRRSYCSLESI